MLRYQNLLVGHGLLILFVAGLAGFMLAAGLIGGVELLPGQLVAMPFYYGTADGWARAHTGGLTNGLLLIAVAYILPSLLGDRMPVHGFVPYSFIFIGWANTAFYWLGNAASNRALSYGNNQFGTGNVLSHLGLGLASIAAFLFLGILAWGAWRLLRRTV